MPKKIIALIAIVLLGTGLFFLLNHSNSDKLPLSSLDHHDHHHDEVKNEAIVDNHKTTPQTRKAYPRDHLASRLNDLQTPIQERVYAVRDLSLDPQESLGKKNLQDLIIFINSENPFMRDPEARAPHNFKSRQLQKEASLRVYGIKRINQDLNYKDAQRALNQIIQKSNDKALIRIAKQVLDAKKEGQDYFENIKKGILSLEPVAD